MDRVIIDMDEQDPFAGVCEDVIEGTVIAESDDSGTLTGDRPLDTRLCSQQEQVELPNIARVARVYVPANVRDVYDQCIVFGEELEKLLTTFGGITDAISANRIRIYANSEGTFEYQETQKKLLVPFFLAGQTVQFVRTASQITGASTGNLKIFDQNPGLLWTALSSGSTFNQCKTFCSEQGAGWSLPKNAELLSVSRHLRNRDDLAAWTGHSAGQTFHNIWVSDIGSGYSTTPPFQFTDNWGNISGVTCVCRKSLTE